MPEYTAGRARILLEPTARGFYTKARTAIKESVGSNGLTADVRLKPISDGFHTEATKKVQATADIVKRVDLKPILSPSFRTSARDQVNAATANLHLSVGLRAEVDFTKANSQILAWRRRQEAVPLRIQVMPQQGGITGVTQGAGSRNWRARNIPGAGVPGGGGGGSMMVAPQVNGPALQRALVAAVKQGVQAANSAPGTTVTPKVKINTRAMDQEQRRMMADLQRRFEDNFRLRIQPTIAGVQLRLPLGSLGTQVIPGAVAAIGSLISSLQQLSQAGLALPGAISVAGASLGTFAIGVSGISDAWKALAAEEDRAANSATTDAARMSTAYNTVRNASVDVTRAQKDLNDARKDARRTLEDLHNEERSNNLSVAEAALNLRKARNELAMGQFAGPLDRDEAIIREARAREGLNEALVRQKRNKEDVVDADKKGVSGADAVVNAQENLTRALQAQTEAMTALKLESSAAANAADKTKAALEKLGPEVAAVVKAVWDSRDAFSDLRKTVSGNMFRGFDTEVKTLIDSSLPLLHRRLGGIGTVWNETLMTFSGNLRSAGTQSIFDRIFGNTEETQHRFNRAIDPIIRGIGTLAAAGSDSMPRLANAIGDVATRFANFISAADNDGRLQRWISDGMSAFATLGRTIGNIGSIINGITRAFGGTFLNNLEQLTKRLGDFLNSGQGQQDLQIFIQNVREDIEAWRPILEDLPQVFGAAMEAARAAIQAVLPILNVFTEVLSASPALIGAVVTAFLGWNVIRPLMTGVQVGMMGVSTLLTQMGTNFASTRAKADDAARGINTAFEVAGKSGSGPAKAASMIGRVGTTLGALAGPFGAIAVVVAALIPLIKGHDDAAEAAKRQSDAIDGITASLDDVTRAAGAKTLSDVSVAMQDFVPTNDAGMKGNVQAAVDQLGFNPTAFAASTLVGGEQARAGFAGSLRETLRPTVQQAMAKGGGALLKGRGMSEDDVINAFLGDPAAVKKFEDTANAIKNSSVRGEANAFGNFNLGDIRTAVEAAGGPVAAAGLAGQFLSERSGNIASAQSAAQTAQQTATGVQPQLSATGKAFFGGSNVTDISYNGSEYGLNVSGIAPSKIENLKARKNRVLGPWPGPDGMDRYTITFSNTDANSLLSFAAGGPTPKTRGPVDDKGGHLAVVHPDEFVVSKQGASRVPAEFLHALNKGMIDPAMLPKFDAGGPVPPAPPSFLEQLWGGTKVAAGQIASAFNAFDTVGGRVTGPSSIGGAPTNPVMNGIVTPGSAAAEAAAMLAKGAAPRAGGVNLSRNTPYLNHNIPLNPSNYYRGVNAGGFDELFDPTGVMRGYGRGGTERMSFQSGFPNDLYVNGPFARSNTIIEGGPQMPIWKQERRSGYTYVDEMAREAIESGETPLRVWQRMAVEGRPIEEVHTWKNIFDSFNLPGFWEGGGVGAGGFPLAPPVLPPIPEPTPPPIGLPVSGVGTGPAPGPVVDSTVPTPTDVHGLGITPPDVLAGQANPADLLTQGVPEAGGDMGNQFLNAWFPWLGAVQSATTAGNSGVGGGGAIDPMAYLGQAGGNFLSSLGSTLMNGVMGFFGLDLSTYMGALQQTVGFYGNKFGPMLAGGAGGAGGQYMDPLTGQVVSGSLDAYNSYGYDTAVPSSTTPLPSRGGEDKLQNNTVRTKRAIEALFPQITEIGGFREDALEWHPSGKAIDVMIPGAGGNNDPTPPEGKVLGDQIYAWAMANKDALGIDYVMWQEKDHYNHLHINTTGGGYPTGTEVYTLPDGTSLPVPPGTPPPPNATRSLFGTPSSKPNPTAGAFSGSGGLGNFFGSGSGGGGNFAGGMPPLDLGQGGGTGPTGASPNAPQEPFTPPGPLRPPPGSKLPMFPGGGNQRPTTMNPFGIPGAPQGLRRPGSPMGPGAVMMPNRMGGRITPGVAPPANYSGGNQQTWDQVYAAFTEAGFPPGEWGALVNLLNGESGWRPTVANPSSGAFGLFQFLGSTQKAYLPDKNPDPYIQGRAGMKYIKDRYGSPAAAWQFWQNQSPHWYDRGGMLPRGMSVNVNQTNEDEVVLRRDDARKAKRVIENAKQMDPRGRGGAGGQAGIPVPPTTKRPGPPLAPDVDIPRALPAPGISGPPAPEPAAQKVGQAPASNSYVHPGLAKGITSGAATLGSIAQAAASFGMMAGMAGGAGAAGGGAGGGGGGGPTAMISGLFQQGGKIATGVANVFSAALTGITKPGTTENPYGVTLKNNQPAPPLAQDNRRVHNGDNNFASMDEWRQQSQLRDAQDMQAQMTRIKV